MYRMELKVGRVCCPPKRLPTLFLMYRMELKATHTSPSSRTVAVPNVPYGVEREHYLLQIVVKPLFLMYRMELKGAKSLAIYRSSCLTTFLMYRMELKGSYKHFICSQTVWFLMYRMELKVKTLLMTTSPIAVFLMYRMELKDFCLSVIRE